MNNGCFKLGNVPHNKGKRLVDYASSESINKIKQTQFKTGERTAEKNNTWKGGVQTMTNDCIYLYDGVGKRIRRPKYIYEFHYGKIPKGWILYHLDKDKHNDHIDNLIAIPRAILIKICANRINANYHELKTEVENYIKTKKQ